MNDNKVASDMLELADICQRDKELFAKVAEFITDRVLLVDEGQGLQRLRTEQELRPYIFQLEQAGGSLQPLSREDAYQAYLPHFEHSFLIDTLLGHDGFDAPSNAETFKSSASKQTGSKDLFSTFLDDSYHCRSQTIEQKETMVSFLAEHLTYCDELIEYSLADEKVLKQCAGSVYEDLAVLERAAQAITDKLTHSRKVKCRSSATKLRKTN